MSLPGPFEVFYGATDPAATHVYVRWWPAPGESVAGLTVAGVVRGPTNELARTLPATVPLADQGPGESLLARAVLPDPCYWTPGAPYLYTVEVEVRDGRTIVGQTRRLIGVRPLGVAGRRFKLGGKNWFPRAIHQEAVAAEEADDLALWREQGAVMIARGPSDELCQRTSEQGVLLLAELPVGDARPNDAVVAEIRRLARWPAVGMAILRAPFSVIGTARAAARNVLFVEERSESADSAADCVLARADAANPLAAAAITIKPMIAARHCEGRLRLAAARSACDALQAELAGRIDVAGWALLPATAGRADARL